MASNSSAIKIGKKGDKAKPKPTVSQSIPAHFYKNYIPPATPKINPQPQPACPDFEALPKISGGVGINLKSQGGSFSLKDSRHPMSMPVHGRGLAGPRGTPFTVAQPNFTASASTEKASDEVKESKEEQAQAESNSLVERTQQLKIGSFTCLDLMGGGGAKLKQLSEARADKDVASQTSQQTASTFASDAENEVAPEPEESDEDAAFDMEL